MNDKSVLLFRNNFDILAKGTNSDSVAMAKCKFINKQTYLFKTKVKLSFRSHMSAQKYLKIGISLFNRLFSFLIS